MVKSTLVWLREIERPCGEVEAERDTVPEKFPRLYNVTVDFKDDPE